jgi:hypothetical protein
MNFLDFTKAKAYLNENKRIISEVLDNSNVNKNHNIIFDILKGKINYNVVMFPCMVSTLLDNNPAITQSFLVLKYNKKIKSSYNIRMMININYIVNSKSNAVYSIDFFNESHTNELLFGSGIAKADLTIYTLGQSIAYFLPVIAYVANNNTFSLTKEVGKSIVNTTFNESKTWYYGAQAYTIYESMKSEVIDTAFHLAQGHKLVEGIDDFVWETEDVTEPVNIVNDYKDVCKAIQGGTTNISNIEMSLNTGIITVNYMIDESIKTLQKEIDKATKTYDSEQSNEKIRNQVNLVISGTQHGCILCGGIGLGKSYSVKQQLKDNNYTVGKNLVVLKGNCDAKTLYETLYNNLNSMILIEYGDNLISSNADDETINIINSALNIGKKRVISCEIDGGLQSFNFNGSIIILTDCSSDKIHSSLKDYVFVQELDFDVKQNLNLIKTMTPDLLGGKISNNAKNESYDYINKHNKKVSVHYFVVLALLYQMCEIKENNISKDKIVQIIK